MCVVPQYPDKPARNVVHGDLDGSGLRQGIPYGGRAVERVRCRIADREGPLFALPEFTAKYIDVPIEAILWSKDSWIDAEPVS